MKTCRMLAAACLLLAAGCQLGGRVSEFDPSKKAVHIGTTRINILGTMLPSDFYALHPQLESLFASPVLFDQGITLEGIAQHLRNGSFQFAILSSGEFSLIKDPAGLEAVASGLFEKGGATQKGLVVCKKDSKIEKIADLKGKRFAFGPAKDLLYDYAARNALQYGGVADKDLLRELVPPYTLTGRIHLGSGADVAKTVAFDLTVPAGVIDEATFNAMPEKGGSFLSGPSRDMFRVIGVTDPVPGMIVLAGPKSDPVMVQKMRTFLIGKVKSDPQICQQLKVSGFSEPDMTAYQLARQLVARL